MTTLTIVIVSYNCRADLARCLAALTAAPPRVSHQIVVVDNASTDDTVTVLTRDWPQISLIHAGGNLGFSRANNLAIRQSTSELVLLLNPDTVVSGGQIDWLVAELERDPRLGAVGPRLVDGSGRAELSFGPMMTPLGELRQKILVRGHAIAFPPVTLLVERMTRRSHDVAWVSGACLLVRRSDLHSVGLLDERFFMYTEDVDLCASLRRLGRRVRFVAEAEVVHLRGRSAATAPIATQEAYQRSHVAFYEKHHPRWAPWLVRYLKLRGFSVD